MQYTLSEFIALLQNIEAEADGNGNIPVVTAASDDNGEYLTSSIHARLDRKSYSDDVFTIVDTKCLVISSPYSPYTS